MPRVFGLNLDRIIYSGIRAAGGLLTGELTRTIQDRNGENVATETYTCQCALKSETELDEETGNQKWRHEVTILAASMVGISRINLKGGREMGPGFSSGFSRGFRFGGMTAVVTEPTNPIPAIDDILVVVGFPEEVRLTRLMNRSSSAASYKFEGR